MKYKFIAILTIITLGVAWITYSEAHNVVVPPDGPSDSGVFYNPDADGEGIVLTRSGDNIVFYFYTYHPEDGCWNSKIEGCNDQRWFVSSLSPLVKETFATGTLFATIGLGFDSCVGGRAVTIPESTATVVQNGSCYQLIPVGDFLLTRDGEGWSLLVERLDEHLPKTDPIFNNIFNFDTPLIYATD
jgi:hypothetical protein